VCVCVRWSVRECACVRAGLLVRVCVCVYACGRVAQYRGRDCIYFLLAPSTFFYLIFLEASVTNIFTVFNFGIE
jgi:hypothetical protein